MENLLFDIGNSNIKIYKEKENKLLKKYNFKNTKDEQIIFYLKEIDLNDVENVIVSSVVDETSQILLEYFKSMKKEIYFLDSQNFEDFLSFKNTTISEMGADRVINILACAQKNKNNIILDYGTALTIDVLEENIYHTGYIYPGLNVLKDSLISKTSLLEDFKFSNIQKSGAITTNAQLNNAFLLGSIGVINILLKTIDEQYDISKYNIYFTGGGFKQLNEFVGQELVKKYISYDFKYEEYLNYEGLKIISQKINKK